MDILNPERLEPHILVGIMNERLRLNCDGLETLSEDLGMPLKQIERAMKQIHYHYQLENNQFKPD